jgi:Na+/H+ antiporter NhaA
MTSGATSNYRGRTAWARNLTAPVRDFMQTETGSAIVLLGATVAALVWANAPGWHSYESVWGTHLSIRLGGAELSATLREWVNQGLMTFFFLVVGLEAKRELDMGELRQRRRMAVPAIAAAGGILVPIAIYLAINGGGHGSRGWGAAMSTDTAFALGILALLTPRAATRLRVFLLTVAVFDDLGGLMVIAFGYTTHVDVLALAIAVGLFLVSVLVAARGSSRYDPVRAVLGVGVWVAMFESGIDPVITGLAFGLMSDARPPSRQSLERVVELTRSFREQPTPELARTAQRSVVSAVSRNERFQYALHPWTSYAIVPLFALANAGVHLNSGLLGDALSSPITIGIVVAYLVGKPLGILAGSWVASRRALHGTRPPVSWPVLIGGGAVAGVGFTVSLLISSLAFSGEELAEAKIGVLLTVLLAPVTGYIVLTTAHRLPTRIRARQLSATAEEILDLSDDVDSARDHTRGPDDALVTIVEYGDFECPFCGQAEPVVRELVGMFGDQLRYVWRHLPLSDVHPTAQLAAEASEAASAQGKFWEMYALLMAHTGSFTDEDLEGFAAELGLDIERFWNDVRERRMAGRVSEDVDSADMSGVTGTPTFFINRRRHHGAYDIDTLTEAVEAARRRASLLSQAV